ncbi:MAG: hypothetical protein GX562_06675 [Coriobacteriaceae bacterium]|nr:hypothetical protein [Coriobacteriaceae bacterium]
MFWHKLRSFALLLGAAILFTAMGTTGIAQAVERVGIVVDYDIITDTTWSGNGNYTICSTGSGEPKIKNGATLTIESGAVVYFADTLSGNLISGETPIEYLTVESGNLIADGVRFTVLPDREARGWGGIIARASGVTPSNLSFTNCIFEYTGFFGGGAAIHAQETSSIEAAQDINITVSECVFRYPAEDSTGIRYENGYHKEAQGIVTVEDSTFTGFGRGIQIDRNSGATTDDQDEIYLYADGCTFNDSTLRSVEVYDGMLASVKNCIFNNNTPDNYSITMYYDYNDSNHPKEVVLDNNTFNGPTNVYPIAIHAASQINKDISGTCTFSSDLAEEFRYVKVWGDVGNGEVNMSGIWGDVGVPYLVEDSANKTGTVQVSRNNADSASYSDLTIRPGVTVCLMETLIVSGTLNAIGTEAAPILFTSKPNTSWDSEWGQIETAKFRGQLNMSYCIVENLYRGVFIAFDGKNNLNENAVTIDNCQFRMFPAGHPAIQVRPKDLPPSGRADSKTVISNTIVGCTEETGAVGVEIDSCTSVTLLNCLVYGFSANGVSYMNDSQYFPIISKGVVIENCTVADNDQFGIRYDFKNFQYRDDPTDAVILRNSIVSDNGVANLALFNRYGQYATPEINQSIEYSLIGQDNIAYEYDRFTLGSDTYAKIPDTAFESCLFDADPLFADAANDDYHLKSKDGRYADGTWVTDGSTSPAIDAGDPFSRYSLETLPNGGRVNMGCYGNTLQASRSITIDSDWTSLDGAGRYDTMKKIVAAGWTSKTDTVIVATGGNFPDALAASSLAGIKDAPVVLTSAGILSQ